MTYIRESFDLPPFALVASASALFALGCTVAGPVCGGILVTSAAIARELAMHWFGSEVSA